MASIDLPRALQDYFSFAETTPTRSGRRFSITMPYVGPDGRLDRLQWWYHLSEAKEKALGEGALEILRAQAIARFEVHIDRWLQNTAQVLFGDGAIPQVVAEGTRGSHIYAGLSIPTTAIPATGSPPDAVAGTVPEETVVTEERVTECGDESAANAQDEIGQRSSGKTAFG